jgi:two-component system sensor histidine kinase MtrB
VHTLLAAPRWIRRTWRRSLLLRITSTTLVLSLIVVGALGYLLLGRVTAGLLESKERIAVGEAASGVNEAQRLLDAADTGPTTPSPGRLVDSVVTTLATRAGAPGEFDLLLLSSGGSVELPERGTNLVAVASVPADLRTAVVTTQRQSWTYTTIRYLDGRQVAGLAVGAPLTVPTVGAYELYYLFPLAQEQATLDLVRGAVLATGAVLVILLVLIAALVTRQVVVPVRAAAQTAARLSHGLLEERMRVRGEDDLAQLATSFNDMAQSLAQQIHQLENLSRVQQRFVSDVSHELRTPLTTVRMASDVLFEERSNFDAPTARAAELLQTQLDRFEALLADLLEISRFDAGAVALETEVVDLRSLVERAIDAVQPLADRLHRPVRLYADQSSYPVDCDARRVDRIVRNLLDNAIEHANELGVDVTLGLSARAAAITVRDYGIGLRPGESQLVFTRFWRADPARARNTGGTGLGLAIAQEDARLHGGWLEAWGRAGRGACFRLTLPLTSAAELRDSPLPLAPMDDVAVAR